MFKKAERKQVKLKLSITGPTGSGKTYSALRLATGIGKKIAFIDTENGSASLYADKFDFDVIDLQPPFVIEKYTQAIEAAEKAGYDVIVIDSLSHAWSGEGGLLEQKALLDSRPGSNHWTNWNPITKKDNQFKNAFLHSKCHIITTMRSKMEYTQAEENGKKKIQKLGMAPIQRDGIEYEFTVVFDVAMDHKAQCSKDRTGIFVDDIFQITEETGQKILNWLSSAKTVLESRSAIKIEPESDKRNSGALSSEDEPPIFDDTELIDRPSVLEIDQVSKPVDPKNIPNMAQTISALEYKKLVDWCTSKKIPNNYVKELLKHEFKGLEAKQLNKIQYLKLMSLLGYDTNN